MNDDQRIVEINQVISDYFKNNTVPDWVAAKELMPYFIKAGVFTTDQKKGLPIRKVLRTLDEKNALDQIPFTHAERKDKNTFWYFVRKGSAYVSEAHNDTGVSRKRKVKVSRTSSDEHYLMNLCDELLDEKAFRQHKFGFILGDYHKDGKTRTALPVDAYYKGLNLVLEFMEKQHTEAVDLFDKPERKTNSGVSRAEQRKIYDQRKRKGLKAKEIQLVEIDYSSFNCDNSKQLIRELEKDKEVLTLLLKDYIK